ncbi:MAG: 6-phosphogluconolactonase [Chlamydiota bacterium]
MNKTWNKKIKRWDSRRQIALPGNYETTVAFCVEHILGMAQEAIDDHGYFAIALSGGSTPEAIYRAISHHPHDIDWSKTKLFWSDERVVPHNHPESNYHMAMKSGLEQLLLRSDNIFRMDTEKPPHQAAEDYEVMIKNQLISGRFDLVMLGMGEDGHTASLFPKTKALNSNKLVAANYIPKLKSWRLTLTMKAINQSHKAAIYLMGKSKAATFKKVVDGQDLPIQKVGTPHSPALWILDDAANSLAQL